MANNICLVVNNEFQPLGGITEEEAICLIVQEKATAIISDSSKPYRSKNLTLWAPKVVVLGHYVNPRSFQYKPEKLNNTNLFRRDKWTCQYCGRGRSQLQRNGDKLTMDHVVPLSRGGTNEWANVTTACGTCNTKKADRTLDEANMYLLSKPLIPVTWVIRGKAKLTEEQVQYAEEILNIKSSTKLIDPDEVNEETLRKVKRR